MRFARQRDIVRSCICVGGEVGPVFMLLVGECISRYGFYTLGLAEQK